MVDVGRRSCAYGHKLCIAEGPDTAKLTFPGFRDVLKDPMNTGIQTEAEYPFVSANDDDRILGSMQAPKTQLIIAFKQRNMNWPNKI